MYHRPVALSTSNRHGTAMPHLRSRSTLPQNENARGSTKNLGHGTSKHTPQPGSTRTRRAFGDISNKKSANTTAGGGGKVQGGLGGRGSSKNTLVLKPRSSSTKTPFAPSNTNSGVGYQSRIPKLGNASNSTIPSKSNGNHDKGSSQSQQRLSKRSHPWSQKPLGNKYSPRNSNSGTSPSMRPRPSNNKGTKSTKIPSPRNTVVPPSSSLSRKVDFPVPKRTTPAVSKPRLNTTVHTATTVSSDAFIYAVDPVDDVELPAGRTWDQQLDYELRDDDDYSTSSMGETLERRTMWDDWRDSMQRQWENKKAEDGRAEDRMVQKHIEEVMKREMKDATGIDGLIDMVESLQVNYSLNLDNSLDLDALLEDDDWSAPASSLDGIMDDDLEL